MLQLILHLVGDYCTQSDWMALEKTKSDFAAGAHAWVYAMPFFLVTSSSKAIIAICLSHFLIDRFRLARYLVYVKNFLAPRRYWFAWADCSATGYHSDRPAWLAVWLMIAADNTIHLACNYAAIALL